MCVVSAVGDYYQKDFDHKWPDISKVVNGPTIQVSPDISHLATKEDIEQIRKELLELKKLLKAAIQFDESTDQVHCENEDKIALIKRIADMVGVDLSDLNLN